MEKALTDFPDEFTLDELMDKLILLDKIAKGEKDSQEGRIVSETDLEQKMKKWF